jgi:hypothetical protein
MAYFSNGTEGDMYEAEYCERCVHHVLWEKEGDRDCAVLEVHAVYNCDQNKNDMVADVLGTLIPEDEEGHTLECRMFILKEA